MEKNDQRFFCHTFLAVQTTWRKQERGIYSNLLMLKVTKTRKRPNVRMEVEGKNGQIQVPLSVGLSSIHVLHRVPFSHQMEQKAALARGRPAQSPAHPRLLKEVLLERHVSNLP